ncbi:MAG: hypothetical protein OHK0013_43930 [Sandaracinaceae bacterium]
MHPPHAARSPLERPLRAVLSLLGIAAVVATAVLSSGSNGCRLTSEGKGEGEPCVRTSECEDDLVCASGVCREAGDAGAGDAGLDGDR